MSDVFDRLQRTIELQKQEEGISPLDIAELPPHLRKVLKIILREVELSYSEIYQIIQELDEKDQMTVDELDEALKLLTRQMWLIRRGEGERVRYEVNLRRKAGKVSGGIWGILDSRLEEEEKSKK